MAGDGAGLFEGLPPPSAPVPVRSAPPAQVSKAAKAIEPAKPAIKREASQIEGLGTKQARVRFKTSTETSKEKVIEAIQKIKAHIGNPSKFSKACKLALQLLSAGSIGGDTATPFFELLEVAMSPPSKANAADVRVDYHRLFSAVQDKIDCFTPAQKDQVELWLLWAQLGNDFYTDDTFLFSKAAGRLRQAISSLPEATAEEAVQSSREETPSGCEEVDPFGLDALLPNKEDKLKKKPKDEASETKASGNLQRERREALIECLTIAAKRYKLAWAQTIIDITAKHASDNLNRFDRSQRDRIVKLCVSIKEQQVRRKQGKSSSGKLDETSFEKYRELYANEKISIRKAVGGTGDRSAEQWLG